MLIRILILLTICFSVAHAQTIYTEREITLPAGANADIAYLNERFYVVDGVSSYITVYGSHGDVVQHITTSEPGFGSFVPAMLCITPGGLAAYTALDSRLYLINPDGYVHDYIELPVTREFPYTSLTPYQQGVILFSAFSSQLASIAIDDHELRTNNLGPLLEQADPRGFWTGIQASGSMLFLLNRNSNQIYELAADERRIRRVSLDAEGQWTINSIADFAVLPSGLMLLVRNQSERFAMLVPGVSTYTVRGFDLPQFSSSRRVACNSWHRGFIIWDMDHGQVVVLQVE
jgi:hypothetical protein